MVICGVFAWNFWRRPGKIRASDYENLAREAFSSKIRGATPAHPHATGGPRGRTGCKRGTHTNTHTPQQPSQEGRNTAETRAQHARPHHRPQPGMASYKRGAHTNTHTPQHPSQEWPSAAATGAQAHTPAPHPQPVGAGDHVGRAHKHTHTRTPPLQVAGRSQDPNSSTHAHTAYPNRERRSTGGAHTQPRTPQKPQTSMVGCRPKPKPNRKHREPLPGKEGCNHNPYQNTPNQDPNQGWQAYRNQNPSTTRTQTQTAHKKRNPSVQSPGTEAARAMQVTRPNEIRSPGVRLHPKPSAAFGLVAERAKPKRLGTPVPRTCMHAFGTGYTRKSGEPLGFRPKEGTCASTGAHPPGETSTSRRRRSALSVLPGAALLGATSQV